MFSSHSVLDQSHQTQKQFPGSAIYWSMDGYHESIVRFRRHLKVSAAGGRSLDYWMIDLEIITSDSTCQFLEAFLEWTIRSAWMGYRSWCTQARLGSRNIWKQSHHYLPRHFFSSWMPRLYIILGFCNVSARYAVELLHNMPSTGLMVLTPRARISSRTK